MKSLEKEQIEDILALTPMQEGMLFHYLQDPGSEYYFEQLSLQISGNIDVHRFKQTWQAVIDTHEMLRVLFRWDKVETPLQVILKEKRFDLEYVDLSEKVDSEKERGLEAIKEKDREKRFDLSEVPFRVTLVKTRETAYVMIISNHHILYDGWSNGILWQEFLAAYLTGKGPGQSGRPSFKEFVQWIRQQDKPGQEVYWLDYLSGFTVKTGLPWGPGREKNTAAVESVQVEMGKDFVSELQHFVTAHKLTAAALLYSAWGILLQSYGSSDDVVFGTTVSGRSAKVRGIEQMVGLFINTLPFRFYSPPDARVENLLTSIHALVQEREPYEHTSLVDLHRWCGIDAREGLFDSVLVVENWPLDTRLRPGDSGSEIALMGYSAFPKPHYDLTLEIRISEALRVNFLYNPQRFDADNVRVLACHFMNTLREMIGHPEKTCAELEILAEEEKRGILHDLNCHFTRDIEEKTLVELFTGQVERVPDRIALLGPISNQEGAGGGMHVSYGELNRRAGGLGGYLSEKGIGADTIVGIMTTRSLEMIVGILGILKAGGAYMPIDPAYPQERIDFMLKDSAAKVLVTTGNLLKEGDKVGRWDGEICYIEELLGSSYPLTFSPSHLHTFSPSYLQNSSNPATGHQPPATSLAYIIYTSGTTGNPKGTLVEQHNIAGLMKVGQSLFHYDEQDTWTMFHSYGFDFSVWEMYGALLHGGKLVLVPGMVSRDPGRYLELLRREQVTVLNQTPGVFYHLVQEEAKVSARGLNIRLVIFGGEALRPDRLKPWREKYPGTQLINMYGITETTVHVTVKEIGAEEIASGVSNIGRAIPSLFVYIMDLYARLVPRGVPGELWVGGRGVSRGYLNNPELTAEKFCLRRPGGRFLKKLPPWTPGKNFLLDQLPVYRSGDRVRMLNTGEIEYLGRIDHQVKIRGHRVELAEIEEQMMHLPQIQEALVITREDEHGVHYLCAYVILTPGNRFDVSDLRRTLSMKLPGYMIPAYFIALERFPVTAAGKVDRKKLPLPEGLRPALGNTYLAPGNKTARDIAVIWQDLLKLDKVGIHDNFFDLGGNSLLMIRLKNRLQELLTREIAIMTLFQYPTIHSLTQYLNQTQADAAAGKKVKSAQGLTGREIAVIGMAGRFPGARSMDQFWENLKNGKESIGFFSDNELAESAGSPRLLENHNFVKAKGILEGVDCFDAFFFNYTLPEAEMMDPQFRVLHESAWKALEDAGYDPGCYQGFIGFYAGATTNLSWIVRMLGRIKHPADKFQLASLNDGYSLSTQVAYRLNLKGPAVTVQTACSTSLVAIHHACRALLNGECDMALAGGVSVQLPVKNGYLFQEGMVFSSDGHCRVFDARATGTVEGNGAGLVVLKPLENALEDRDHIYAVIRGSAINNDGNRKVGYSAPSIEGQAEVIRRAHQAADVEPESITYVETHGTGTTLGDPVEIKALSQAFAAGKRQFCCIGSVKSNIGHLDSAAGAAGFIKTALALYHKMIPPTLHFETPNLQIDFENSPFIVNTRLTDWKQDKFPLRAGVSSFGIGGTNAHMVLEEWPVASKAAPPGNISPPDPSRHYQLILLSAKTPSALERNTANLAKFFKTNPDLHLPDAAYTLQVGRKAFEYRMAFVCHDLSGAVEALAPGKQENLHTHLLKEENPAVVFMFPGLGSQYVNMGHDLYRDEQVFREEIDRCFALVKSLIGIDLKGILYPSPGHSVPGTSNPGASIHDFGISQLIIFTFEYALARLLMKWGLRPNAVIGYSFGEYAAACAAGVFSPEDALRLIVHRGELIEQTPRGGMLSVPCPREEVMPLLSHEPELCLAIDNGSSCIVSGPEAAIDDFETQLKQKRWLCMRLHAAHALHSTMMDAISGKFAGRVGEAELTAPQIPIISNVTGQWLSAAEAVDPAYWARHLQRTVRFADGIKELVKEPQTIFLEIGPGRDLSVLVQRYLEESQKVVNLVRSPQQQVDDRAYLLNRLGRLWAYGKAIDWKEFYEGEKRYRLSLPTYSFEPLRFPLGPEQDGGVPLEPAEQQPGMFFPQTRVPDTYEAPAGSIEKKVAAAFRSSFGLNKIGRHDDFFELGGDSLKAITFVSAVHRQLNVEIPLETVFKHPTVKGIAEYIEQKAEKRFYLPIQPVEKREYYPLTSSQERVFILQQMEEQNISYNMPSVMWIEGPLDIKRLERICLRLIRRHEALRTGFFIKDGGPVQQVQDQVEFKLAYHDGQAGGADRCDRRRRDLISSFLRPFDLARPPLWRVGLVKAAADKYVLLDDLHHIISDDISIGILITELSSLYAERQLEEIRLQYKDYALWQEEAAAPDNSILMEQKAFWLDCFSGELPVLNMLPDYPRPSRQCSAGANLNFKIDAALADQLLSLAGKNKTTLFILLFTVYNILLYKYTGQKDIIVGTPITGRTHRDVRQVVGMFVNTLALRNSPAGYKTVAAFVQEVKANAANAFSNQLYPFESLVEQLALPRDISRHPLFDTMFVFHTVDLERISINGLKIYPYEFENPTAKFDITLNVSEAKQGLNVMLEYAAALFKKETMERFRVHFLNIIEKVIENPLIITADIDMLCGEEKRQILYDFNATTADYPRDKSLHRLFEEQEERTPDQVALFGQILNASGEGHLSYRELDRKSARLASGLIAKGVKPDTIVGIMVGRSIEMLVGILGILKTGAAYLPLDPDYPEERTRYMLHDAMVKIVVNNSKYFNDCGNGEGLTSTNFSPGEGLAYVIYTSGSTGRPKGVCIGHRNVINFITGITGKLGFSAGASILALTTISFDIFVLETLLPLLKGLRVVMTAGGQQQDPWLLAGKIVKERVDMLQMTPSTLKLLLEGDRNLSCLEKVGVLMVGGEAFPQDLLERLSAGYKGEIYNLYGPTETTVWSAVRNLTGAGKIDLGAPISNTAVYILDRHHKLQPLGVAGELCIAGDGVARGYLNNPELTAEKFERDVNRHWSFFSGSSLNTKVNTNDRFYKTGDLARWLPEGNIEFLGRTGDQVKLRGFRIELGEIRGQLLTHDKIKETVVIAQGGGLCAYIVPREEEAFENPGMAEELKRYLSRFLPAYMIPGHFVTLERLPLTLNGKIDRKALPEPTSKASLTYTAPRDRVEKKLVEIWETVLHTGHGSHSLIGIDDHFFEFGGHSLQATLLVSIIHKTFNARVPLHKVFEYPTIRAFAGFLKTAVRDLYQDIEAVEKREYYPQSSAQKRLFFLDRFEDIGTSYNMPAVYKLEGLLDKNRLEKSFKALVHRHEAFRTSFHMINNEPVQHVHDEVEFEIQYFLATGGAENTGRKNHKGGGTPSLLRIPNHKSQIPNKKERSNTAQYPDPKSQELRAKSFFYSVVRPFDLSRAPLLRVVLSSLKREEHWLLFDMHHIIGDGTAMELLAAELTRAYTGESSPPLRIRYTDFSLWQNHRVKTGALKEQEDYWLNLYSPAREIPRLNLPTDYPRPGIFDFNGSGYEFVMTEEEAAGFNALARKQEVTLYMNLSAAFNVLLYHYSGQTDIMVGCGIAGRSPADLLEVIGMFVNMLAIRNYPAGQKTYREFLREVKENTVKAFENQDVQFEDLVERLELERDPSRNPLFDVSLVVQNFERFQGNIQGLRITPAQLQNKTSKFDLTLFAVQREDQVHFNLEYGTKLFKPETIKRISRHFLNIIRQVSKEPGILLAGIDIMTGPEKQQLVYDFNRTARLFPADKTVPQLFAEQVERRPDNIAVIGLGSGVWGQGQSEGGYRKQHLTYSELNKKSNLLADYLYGKKGIGADDRVGILMGPCVERAAAMLGVLKAGGGYVPMDPFLPERRIKMIGDDAGLGVVLSQKRYIRLLNRLQWDCQGLHTFLCLDSSDIYAEDEEEKSELMDEQLWKHVAEMADDDIAAGGWHSSFTGKPFTRAEMDEYGDNILQKLEPLLHHRMRILEIGCASGITMYRLAHRVGFYLGTDLSQTIIRENEARLKIVNRQNIRLACMPAHKIDNLEEKNFDLVIINSVIQCFPGHNYLRKVVRKAIQLLAPTGYLFIGDVMDRDLKSELIRSLEDFKYKQARGKGNNGYTTKTDFSAELFVSRAFFRDLAMEIPAIRAMEFSKKQGTLENELTRFRYDVLMTIDKGRLGVKTNRRKQAFQEDLKELAVSGLHRYHSPLPRVYPHHIAYIIYTSGTTGQPRGVAVEHRSLVNLCCWHNSYYAVKPVDIATQYASFGFDASVWEIFPYLAVGASVHIIEDRIKLDIHRLSRYYETHGVTISFLPTPMAEQFMLLPQSNGKGSLRALLTGGDQLRTFMKQPYPLYNNYGPTENTVVTTSWLVQEENEKTLLGRPLYNNRVYILKPGNSCLQPLGIPGELCIAGDGLARGYLNNPELTFEKFINYKLQITNKNMPFGQILNAGGEQFSEPQDDTQGHNRSGLPAPRRQRLYKTGDLARWLSDGNIEFLGRIDHQVKIRGYRIELAEIEGRLSKHQEIKDAVVIARGTPPQEAFLCAYIVPAGGGDETVPGEMPLIPGLKDYLSQVMPDYMVPSQFVFLERVPLNSAGKIDRKVLAGLEVLPGGVSYAAPQNRVQEILVGIWQEILAIPSHRVGIDDNFFDLGGHSLKATVLVSRIHRELEVKIPLAEIFKRPFIRGLSEFIDRVERDRFLSIEPVEKREYYPLSPAQQRLYILQQMDTKSIAYNMPMAQLLEGEADKNRIEAIFQGLIQRQEGLRTSFHMIGNQPVQRIHQENYNFQIVDPRGGGEGEPAAVLLDSFIRPFDLSQSSLLRMELCKIEENKHILLVDMHHIISDGISMNILTEAFMTCYGGKEPGPSGLRIQYKDYSRWFNSEKTKYGFQEQKMYWLGEFSHDIPVMDLPLDYPRPALQSVAGDTVSFEPGREGTRLLHRLAREQDTTLFMVLLALFNVLLAKLSGQEDIIVGSPIAARPHSDLQGIVGMFVNTLALRSYPAAEKTFREFLQEVKQKSIEAFENQVYPFEELVEAVAITRDASRNPLFDVMFVLQNQGMQELEIPGLTLRPYPREMKVSRFDMTWTVLETKNDDQLNFTIEYAVRLFKPETIHRFWGYFRQVLEAVLRAPGIPLTDIEIISPAEKQKILYGFNYENSRVEAPAGKTLHQLFTAQVEQTPDRTALLGQIPNKFGENVSMTYNELEKKSVQLSYWLREKGVQPDTLVGILVEPSIEMIIGLLGILMAGGAYLPMDPEYPQERIDYMLKDSSAKLLVTNNDLEELPNFPLFPATGHRPPATSLAYVIYTSGSTGRPKGSLISHRNVVRLMTNDRFRFEFNDNDVWTLFHSYCFDFSVWEMYGALLYGGKLVIVPRMTAKDTVAFLEVLKQEKVTVLNQTPSAFYQLMTEELKSGSKKLNLKYVIFGGEALNPSKLKAWKQYYPRTRLINMYGITETTVHVTYKELREQDLESSLSAIGLPIPTLTAYIVDRDFNLQPVGVPGELWVGGQGVCRGYLNRPELTAEKFCLRRSGGALFEKTAPPEPPGKNVLLIEGFLGGPGGRFFKKAPLVAEGKKLYKTGDRVKMLANGEMEYLGRIDQQVKIRGYRIELGEIETLLLKHRWVKNALVVARQDRSGDRYLCAYLVRSEPGTPGSLQSTQLREHLSAQLPGYMVPSFFVYLEEIPLTANGKINRNALPDPVLPAGDLYAAPGNRIEKKLIEIWQDVLFPGQSSAAPGINDNFFELGGHSLKALGVVNAVHKVFNVQIGIPDIFLAPTIAKLAAIISRKNNTLFMGIVPLARQEYYKLSYAQQRLWVLQKRNPGSPVFNMPVRVTFSETPDEGIIREVSARLSIRHEALRTYFVEIHGEVVQKIAPQVAVDVKIIDLSHLGADALQKQRDELVAGESLIPFNLEKAPLLRVKLVKCREEEFDLIFTVHHLVSDGWSLEILHREFSRYYQFLKEGRPYLSGPLRIQYKDYAHWHNRLLADREKLSAVLEFWQPRLAGPPVLELPYDFPPGELTIKKSAAFRVSLDPETTGKLKTLARDWQASLFMVLLAGFNLLLWQLTGQEDLFLGMPGAARQHEDIKNTVGLFVNTLVLRTAVEKNQCFGDFLKVLREDVMKILECQGYPLELICDELGYTYPTISLFFNMVNTGQSSREPLPALATGHMDNVQEAKFPLALYLVEYRDGIDILATYFTRLFLPETVEKIMNNYLRLLQKIAVEPDQPLKEYRSVRKRLLRKSFASGGQGGSFRENRPPGPPAKAFD